MPLMHLEADDDIDGWRAAARALALNDVPPEQVRWRVADAQTDLFTDAPGPLPVALVADARFTVPRRFVDLADATILHRDAARFALLYTMLLRLRHQPRLIE